MNLDNSILPPDFEQHNLTAGFHPNNRLASFGKQKDGKPVGPQLTLDPTKPRGRVEELTIRSYPDPDQDDPTRGKAAEEAFAQWVERWVAEIYDAASYTTRCSFCGKTNAEVETLIAGPNVYICNECVLLCNTILGEKG